MAVVQLTIKNKRRNKMEFNDLLQRRRSVREYINKTVEEEKIREMIEAAIQAPSWKNSQVTRYYVVSGQKTLEQIKSALAEFNQKNVSGAPVLIVTTIVRNRSGYERDGTPSNELGNGWGYYDCGLQNMNLLLKASELGLSSLVMGIRDAEKIRDMLDVPENEAIVSVIGIGYSDADGVKPARKSVDDITRFF